ncbi:MAG: Flp pilus assembly protein CpaB [Limnochordia bacterium]|jgi:pilus assembly protein CpaB
MKNPRLLLVIALLFGLLSAGLVYRYVGSLTEAQKEEVATIPILVAARDIPYHTTITGQTVKRQQVPLEYVHPDAITDVNAVVGRFTKADILAGEPILESRLYGEGEGPGLAYNIPEGKIAVTVAVNEVLGVAGFLKSGDYVDVFATFPDMVAGDHVTTTILQHVQVLAVAQRMERDPDAEPRVSTTATLAVTPKEAEKLIFAEENGRLRLALKPLNGPAKIASTNPITLREVVGGNFLRKEEAVVIEKVTDDRPLESRWQVEVIRGVEREIVHLN